MRGTRLAGMLAVALTIAAVTTVAHDAPAQTKPAAAKVNKKTKLQAKKAYLMGKKKMSAGDYASALEQFQKADELVPGAAPKYQIAVCFDKLGKAKEAVEAKLSNENFVNKAKPQVVAQARNRLAELSEQLKTVEKHLSELES